MRTTCFVNQVNEQIGNEFAAHQQHVACAVHYDALTMPRLAACFYDQALRERDHAMRMVRFLIATGSEVVIPAVPAPVTDFSDAVAPVELALELGRRMNEQIFAMTRTAREEKDLAAEQFMQWFVKEQVDTISTMTRLLAVVTRVDLARLR